jgi:hypothetical protein
MGGPSDSSACAAQRFSRSLTMITTVLSIFIIRFKDKKMEDKIL